MIDAIQLWNDVALEASQACCRVGGGGTENLRVLAIVHQAMYDAYVTVAKPAEFVPSLPGLPAAPAGASAAAAIAGAAHGILTALCPVQRALLDATLAAAADPDDPGLPIGRAIAEALLEAGEAEPGDDGGATPAPSRGSGHVDPGHVDPDHAASELRGALGLMLAGAMRRATRSRAWWGRLGVTMGKSRAPRIGYPRAASPAASIALGAL
ncbi:MAG TPA: hypothetical protein VNO30_36385 [Kofleriaceae bacterium]|nr:hypothetical protein [Kofleriaceae bacterium]